MVIIIIDFVERSYVFIKFQLEAKVDLVSLTVPLFQPSGCIKSEQISKAKPTQSADTELQ